jgi:hypothetical protein
VAGTGIVAFSINRGHPVSRANSYRFKKHKKLRFGKGFRVAFGNRRIRPEIAKKKRYLWPAAIGRL